VKEPGYIYILESSIGYYKIGYTKNLKTRTSDFGVTLPFDVWLLHAIDVSIKKMPYYEKFLHKLFADRRVSGEWFVLDYYALKLLVEFFQIDEDLDKFKDWLESDETQDFLLEHKCGPEIAYMFELVE
jgi:hypothetical protein